MLNHRIISFKTIKPHLFLICLKSSQGQAKHKKTLFSGNLKVESDIYSVNKFFPYSLELLVL